MTGTSPNPRTRPRRLLRAAIAAVAALTGLAVSASIPQAHAESSEQAIQFVVDTSGSMAGEKLDSAIAAIRQTAAAIPDSTALGLRSYAGDCDQSAVPPLVPLAPGNDAQIDAAAAGLTLNQAEVRIIDGPGRRASFGVCVALPHRRFD